jgi:hypothetical protein
MQASGRTLSMSNIARILLKDEGLLRFWKGAHVMASGCVPAHASYFLAYEHLKLYWHVDNNEFSFFSTLAIGSSTTFVHDFFITPADGKSLIQRVDNGGLTLFSVLSDQAETTTVQELDSCSVLEEHS